MVLIEFLKMSHQNEPMVGRRMISERGFYARYVNDTIQLLRKFHGGSKEIATADGIRMISREKATKE